MIALSKACMVMAKVDNKTFVRIQNSMQNQILIYCFLRERPFKVSSLRFEVKNWSSINCTWVFGHLLGFLLSKFVTSAFRNLPNSFEISRLNVRTLSNFLSIRPNFDSRSIKIYCLVDGCGNPMLFSYQTATMARLTCSLELSVHVSLWTCQIALET